MSQPAGSDHGLEPIVDHTIFRPPVTSRDILTNDNDYRDGSEYSGVSGLVQPAPHVPNATERLSAIYAIDPTDDGTEAGSVLPPDLEGDFRSQY